VNTELSLHFGYVSTDNSVLAVVAKTMSTKTFACAFIVIICWLWFCC